MKQTVEVPDKIIIAKGKFKDELRIFKRGKKIGLYVSIDGCGNEFIVDKKDLLE